MKLSTAKFFLSTLACFQLEEMSFQRGSWDLMSSWIRKVAKLRRLYPGLSGRAQEGRSEYGLQNTSWQGQKIAPSQWQGQAWMEHWSARVPSSCFWDSSGRSVCLLYYLPALCFEGSQSIPIDSSLGCILSHWKQLSKKKKLFENEDPTPFL